MIQPRRGPRLAERPLTEILALVRDENLLDRDFAIQDLVIGPPDKAHAALPQEPGKPVPASNQTPRLVGHAAMVAPRRPGANTAKPSVPGIPGSPTASVLSADGPSAGRHGGLYQRRPVMTAEGDAWPMPDWFEFRPMPTTLLTWAGP